MMLGSMQGVSSEALVEGISFFWPDLTRRTWGFNRVRCGHPKFVISYQLIHLTGTGHSSRYGGDMLGGACDGAVARGLIGRDFSS